jgi:hypothetical protein
MLEKEHNQINTCVMEQHNQVGERLSLATKHFIDES